MVWLLAFVPFGWLSLFGVFVVRARLALGYWPTPYHPDPKQVGLDLHYTALVLGMPAMFAAIACLGVLALASWRHRRERDGRPALALLVGLVNLALTIAIARWDPHGLFTWLGD